MQNNWESKRDWILFRERIAGWQEAYIGRLNREYIELLSRDCSEAEKFWELYRRIRRDKRNTGVLIEMRSFSPIFAAWSMRGQSAMTISTDSVKNCVKM